MSCEAAGVAADGGLGDECGSDQGACEKGRISCVDGVVVCVGEVTATQERCDCVDNDCDRAVDEDEGAGLCDGDQACAMCQCAAPCDGVPPSESCASGKAAVHVEHEGSERCLCVDSRCDADECSQQVIELGGEAVCAPAAQGVAACVCKENECSAVCAHVVCEGRWICDPLDGECKDPSCLAGFFPCAADQHCRLVDGGYACVSDPCADKACAGDEACRDGSCEKSCAKLACSPGNHCQGGYCVLDLCADSACGAGQVCNPADGGCVSEGACVNAGCPARQVCDPVAGDCIEDPCLALRCPVGERCESATGQCEAICFGSLLYCGGTCVNPQSSNDYCGASADCLDDRAGTACGSEQICSLGACAGSCAEGLVECEGGCIESQTDQLHCGASGDCQGGQAGQACEAPEVCIGGVCQGIL